MTTLITYKNFYEFISLHWDLKARIPIKLENILVPVAIEPVPHTEGPFFFEETVIWGGETGRRHSKKLLVIFFLWKHKGFQISSCFLWGRVDASINLELCSSHEWCGNHEWSVTRQLPFPGCLLSSTDGVSENIKNQRKGASLVAQWLRICLTMQGTQIRALVWEDPTCHRVTGPVRHNYWACASGACAPQQERPRQWEARAPQWRVAPTRHN